VLRSTPDLEADYCWLSPTAQTVRALLQHDSFHKVPDLGQRVWS